MDFDTGTFTVFGAGIPNTVQPSVAIAASRAGHVGILDLEYGVPDSGPDSGPAAGQVPGAVRQAVQALARGARGHWGLKLRAADVAALAAACPAELAAAGVVILAGARAEDLGAAVAALGAAAPSASVLVEVIDDSLLAAAEAAGAEALVAKGHEAGGRVGDETTFLLVQRLVAATRLPVIAQGGVGMNTAAALKVAGAAGVLLDWQLALFEEACTPPALARAVARMDGSETRILGADLGCGHRVFWRADHKPAHRLHAIDIPGSDAQAFARALRAEVTPEAPDTALWLMGQDAAFAARLAAGHRSLGAALDALAGKADALIRTAQRVRPLAEGAPLAQANGTRFPILQGPMTRVSDVPGFAVSVAEGGALPFLALALMRGAEAETLLAETRARIGARPWGVGILGFVDDALREEQTAAIARHRPDFALIAGGRPDQALALERDGIPTFLHVPSPGLLSLFLDQGARRCIFEGRECGGHVGPRSSAVLWQQAVDAVLDHFGPAGPIDCDLIFAGGVHDARSAAMVSVLAADLAERGARIGVIVGTGYILTREAVETGAVVQGYQDLVLQSARTVLLDSGPGHATRVVDSPIVAEFLARKAELRAQNLDADAVKDALESFNIGRSRIASKGIDRNPEFGRVPGADKFREVSGADQIRLGVYMIGQAANLHREPTTIAALHDAICAGSGAVLDAALPGAAAPQAPVFDGPGMRIAITGLGALLPKARDFAAYWENILDRIDAIEEVPERRWDWRRYYDENRDAPDKIYSRWGGFLDEIEFDPLRYGIPPNSVPSIEPLQLLALETVRQALENAGFKDGVIEDAALRQRTSVIIGVGGGAGPLGQRYAVRASLPALNGEIPPTAAGRLPDWTEDSFPGILLNVIAGRVANRFDLGGVNFTVDAACGSSLAAVMMAAREIETGSADMAIVGGVDSFQNPFDFLAFSKTRALSPRGRCRTFDATADGIAISEGLALVVLRRLEQAEAAGDRIYAVLRGVAGSSDGRDLSLTAPRPEGQETALLRAYQRAGVSPATVGAVEAHGTGTVVGDRIEIGSLSKTFARFRTDRQFCGVGSVKSMIGHTKAAAGCAGLIKMALALHHRVLPSTLNVEVPNPEANFPESPFHVMTEARPWLNHGDTPRRAGVSAFGFGGTNFHAVLEEYDGGYLPRHQAPLRRDWPQELLLFSAASQADLATALRRAAAGLAGAPATLRLCDVAASLAARFNPKDGARFALVAASCADAAQRLARAADLVADGPAGLRLLDPQGSCLSAEAPLEAAQVAFLFPGQGSQYPGMAADLVMLFPQMRRSIEAASRTLAGLTPAPLGDLIYPRPTLDPAEAAAQAETLKRTDVAQPAIGALSLALLELLRGFGLQAGIMAGHSFGEYTALHAAGAFDAATLLGLAHARGDAIIRAAGDDLGAMAAVNAGAAAVRTALGGQEGVTLANLNAPEQTVIAGPTPVIEAAMARLTTAGLAVTRLPVACGFHSDCVAPARGLLAGALERAAIRGPEQPVYANATAQPYPQAADAVRAQLASHLQDPVNFLGAVEAMHAAGARLFLEVGPGAVLTRLAERILAGKPHLALSSDVKGRPGGQQLLRLLAGAAVAGLPLSLAALWAGRVQAQVDVVGWNLEPAPRRGVLWMIDGSNARPAGRAAARKGFAARIEEDPTPMQAVPMPTPMPTSGQTPAATPATTAPVQPVAAPPAAVAPPLSRTAAADSGAASEIMRRHQELMAQFLDNNRAVMMTWLGAGPVAGEAVPRTVTDQPAAPPVMAAPAVAAPAVAPAVMPQSVVTSSVAAPAAAASGLPGADQVLASLLALIADRTGYPVEMLDPDLNLEADLGIDSIKRVEILGALRASLLPDSGEELRTRMGPVSREKTARTIVARFLDIAQGAAAPVAAATAPAPAPAAATSGLPGADQVLASLLALIADRTGYPVEMLDPDLNLEADLGIDSIKRVEILGALRASLLPDSGEELRTRMGPVSREKTARTIVARFLDIAQGAAAPVAAATAPAPAPATAAAAEPDMAAWGARFVMVPHPVPAPPPFGGPGAWVVRGGQYVLTDDGEGVAAGLARLIGAQGGVARLLDPALTDDAGLRAAVADQGPLAAGLIHCAPLRPEADLAGMTAEGWTAAVARSTRVFYTLLSALGPVLSARRDAVVLCATAMGGAFGFDGTVPGSPTMAGAPGLLKTVAKEWPGVLCRAVDFTADSSAADRVAALAAEAGRPDDLPDGLGDARVEIGYRGTERLGLLAQARPLAEDGPAALDLDPGSVVLVTGGARGITAKIALHLARRHRPRFVLLGSSPLPEGPEAAATAGLTEPRDVKAALIAAARAAGTPASPAAIEAAWRRLVKAREIRAALADLQAEGVGVEYLCCDVRDTPAFEAAIRSVYARHGRIDGVLHGAGVIEDKLVLDKDLASFETVMQTKTGSAFTLARMLDPSSLRFLVFFTSVAGRFGNRGQGDYGAANEIVSKLARSLKARWPGLVKAVSWGPWDSGGMVSEEIRAQFAGMRIEPIPPELGVRALELEITRGRPDEPEAVWGRGPWEDDERLHAQAFAPTAREAAE